MHTQPNNRRSETTKRLQACEKGAKNFAPNMNRRSKRRLPRKANRKLPRGAPNRYNTKFTNDLYKFVHVIEYSVSASCREACQTGIIPNSRMTCTRDYIFGKRKLPRGVRNQV